MVHNRELSLQVEKLTCLFKIFSANSSLPQEEVIKIVSDFDNAEDELAAHALYKEIINR